MAVFDLIEYKCIDCGRKPPKNYCKMVCPYCKQDSGYPGRIRGEGPGIMGTKDIFGIRKSFQDDESGETIDNWRTWEKRGFRNPLEVTKDNTVVEKIKAKKDRIKHSKK